MTKTSYLRSSEPCCYSRPNLKTSKWNEHGWTKTLSLWWSLLDRPTLDRWILYHCDIEQYPVALYRLELLYWRSSRNLSEWHSHSQGSPRVNLRPRAGTLIRTFVPCTPRTPCWWKWPYPVLKFVPQEYGSLRTPYSPCFVLKIMTIIRALRERSSLYPVLLVLRTESTGVRC